jgi:hypothetical protein
LPFAAQKSFGVEKMSRHKSTESSKPNKTPTLHPSPPANDIPRKKRTEAELLKGVKPDMCGPELIKGRVGKELL